MSNGVQRRRQTRTRVLKGYSEGRKAYDKRRRAEPLDAVGKVWKKIVLCDPCAFCGADSEDADHIVGLKDGGTNTWDDLAGVCHRCNASKRERRLLLWMLSRG